MEIFGNAVKTFLYDDDAEHLGIVQNRLEESISFIDELLGDEYQLQPDDWFVIPNDEFGRSQTKRLKKGMLKFAGRDYHGRCTFRLRYGSEDIKPITAD